MKTEDAVTSALWWDDQAEQLQMIDQTLLPARYEVLSLTSAEQVAEAISTLRVRGAPAIGVAAAYGLALGAGKELPAGEVIGDDAALSRLGVVADHLRSTRPTAVNLAWALGRMITVAEQHLAGSKAIAPNWRIACWARPMPSPRRMRRRARR